MKYSDLFKNKNYLIFVIANSISRIGDSIDSLAFSYLVYVLTGSASLTGLMLTVNYLPSILIMPFSGVIGDKFNKKKIMVITHLLRSLFVFVILSLYSLNKINITYLYITTFAISTVESFCLPASSSIIPFLISKEEIDTGTSFKNLANTIGVLLGNGLVGVIIVAIGIKLTLLVDALIFLLAAILEIFIFYKETKMENDQSNFFNLLRQGIAYIKQNPFLIKVMLMSIVLNALYMPTESFSVVIVDELYKLDTSFISYCSSACTIGTLLGSAFVPLILKKYHFKQTVLPCGITVGLCIITYVLCPSFNNKNLALILGVLIKFILGVSTAIINGCLTIEYIKTIDPQYLARCEAIFGASSSCAVPLSTSLSSLLVTFIPLKSLILATGMLLIIFVIIFEPQLKK